MEGNSSIQNDIEEQADENSFEKKERRVHFVRMVYSILTAMLLVDAGCIALGLYIPCVNAFMRENLTALVFAALIFTVLYGTLVFFEVARRRAPYNFLLMAAITLSAGYVLAAAAAKASQEAFLYAATGTSIVAMSVTMMAVCCACDFTGHSLMLFMAGVSVAVGTITFILASIFSDLGGQSRLLHMGISFAFVVLFALYLAYDTQLVLGGGRQELKADEYVHGALHLWVDITLMFLNLLQISQLSCESRVQPSPRMKAAP